VELLKGEAGLQLPHTQKRTTPAMPMPDHIGAIRIPFRLQVGPGKSLERFVYAYVIFGPHIVVIDSGVAGSAKTILDSVRARGRDPQEVATVVLTHAHLDHIGGLASRSGSGRRSFSRRRAQIQSCPRTFFKSFRTNLRWA